MCWVCVLSKAKKRDDKKLDVFLMRFADAASLSVFIQCVRNLATEAARASYRFVDHTTILPSEAEQEEGETCEDDTIIEEICRFASLLRTTSSTPTRTHSVDELDPLLLDMPPQSIKGFNQGSQIHSPVVERKGHELFELSQRPSTILTNPSLLSSFLNELNEDGVTQTMWELIICDFFPLLADTTVGLSIFTLLCSVEDCFSSHPEGDEPVYMLDGENGEVYAKFFEMIRERYRKRKQKRSTKRIDRSSTIAYEVLEAYIMLLQKEMEKSLNRQSRLQSALGKYKEKLQFGSFSVGTNVWKFEDESGLGDFDCLLFCG